MISFESSPKFNKDATLIFLQKGQIDKKSLSFITNSNVRNILKEVIDAGQFNGEDREIFPIVDKSKIILLVGVGDKKETNLTTLRTSVRLAALSPYLKKARDVEVISQNTFEETIIAIIEGILIGTYAWDKYCTQQPKDIRPIDRKYVFAVAAKKEFEQAIVTCQGVNLARDLVNDNADIVTSEFLEETMLELIRGKKNVSIEILNKKELKAKGLNFHLAVNQSSLKEPKLIIIKYSKAGKGQGYTAIVGKGITFDTGAV